MDKDKKSLILSNLWLLRTLFDNDDIPTMEYDGNREDKMIELDLLIAYLEKND